ncbi:hypothetical protein BHE90_014965 [Fusarium euwallaceae]|uniref:RNA-dependent RNA polymerase n=1 Tax=Fusarium euwallaceae TaxID=1147111 RepID=A0A430L4P6_9HYPO|nr:hypothetical protein BHE90_014965 [Fusarium euwallaceae]
MEVFCKNIPQDLSDESLKGELQPFMQALGISDWACDKPKRKSQAWIKFLRASDGWAFLEKHGKYSPKTEKEKKKIAPGNLLKPWIKPRDIARLHILKTAVFVEKSTRALDKHAIAHLEHNRDQKSRVPARDPEAPNYSFWVRAISCGGNTFCGPDKTLTYVEHNSLRIPRSVKAKFTPRWFTVWLDNSNRMDFHNETIQDLIAGRSDNSFTLVLTEPPRMYHTATTLENKNAKWERAQELKDWDLIRAYSSTCLVYRVQVSDAGEFDAVLRSIQSRDILAITNHDLPSILWTFVGVENNHHLGRQQLMARAKRLLSSGNLPFAILFQVQALVWNNYINPSGGMELLDLLEQVALDAKEKEVAMPVTTDAMKVLFQRIPYPCPGTAPEELDVVSIMAEVMDAEYEFRLDNPWRDRIYGSRILDHQVWVFKASVTPTRVFLTGPDAESRNRVLRMYPDNNDSFLRVTFCDENGQDLSFNPRIDNESIFSRYRHVMDEGIEIAGRKYVFLGFSHSSLRSHSAWFSAPFPDRNFQQQTCDVILGALGDFQDIRIPAKCAARIGQAFSDTPYAVPLFENSISARYIDDVKSVDGSRVFSDGVGTISLSALEDIWTYLPMRSAAPTCLQIRWGGCKGMLSLDTRLEGKVFCVRKESMMKFPSRDLTELGICDTSSKPLRLVLNRQMIKILEDMGTENEWFFNLQQMALNMLRNVTANATNTSLFLEHQAVGVNMDLPKLVKQLDRMGIDYRRDNFLKTAVEHVVLRELRLLKHKARIPVAKGVTLFGVMDETGFLEAGQVYVTQKGGRDLPSQLSGGDLDGDLYNVIWDPQAMPRHTFEAADYPRINPEPLDRPVTSHDIADFFINFMRTDILGMIATRHVMLADYKALGTLDPDCLLLATMHSTAVDFSKTGIPVDVKELPKPPFYRPDFLAIAPPLKVYDLGQIDHIADHEEYVDEDDMMGQVKYKYYKSEKILGHLYRNVDEKKIWDQDIHRSISTDGPSVWDQLLAIVETEIVKYNLDIDWTRKSEQAWKFRSL